MLGIKLQASWARKSNRARWTTRVAPAILSVPKQIVAPKTRSKGLLQLTAAAQAMLEYP
jgi:hypothetical protein